MLVRQGDRTLLEARATAEPADDVIWRDYYTVLPHIRLTGNASGPTPPETPTEVMLDDTDVAKLVECAIRHPTPNMRSAVLATIWSHPDSFRQIFEFGLKAPAGFPEIRRIVAEALDKRPPAPDFPASNPVQPDVETLLPRMPLPAHLRDRDRQ